MRSTRASTFVGIPSRFCVVFEFAPLSVLLLFLTLSSFTTLLVSLLFVLASLSTFLLLRVDYHSCCFVRQLTRVLNCSDDDVAQDNHRWSVVYSKCSWPSENCIAPLEGGILGKDVLAKQFLFTIMARIFKAPFLLIFAEQASRGVCGGWALPRSAETQYYGGSSWHYQHQLRCTGECDWFNYLLFLCLTISRLSTYMILP